MRLIDADALEKEGWSLHRTVNVDSHTMEYQRKPIADVPTIKPKSDERTAESAQNVPNDELISKKSAIEAVCSACWDWCDEGVCKRVSAIQKIPSAQPEEDCDTCIHGYFGDSQCDNCRVRYPSHYERRTDE